VSSFAPRKNALSSERGQKISREHGNNLSDHARATISPAGDFARNNRFFAPKRAKPGESSINFRALEPGSSRTRLTIELKLLCRPCRRAAGIWISGWSPGFGRLCRRKARRQQV